MPDELPDTPDDSVPQLDPDRLSAFPSEDSAEFGQDPESPKVAVVQPEAQRNLLLEFAGEAADDARAAAANVGVSGNGRGSVFVADSPVVFADAAPRRAVDSITHHPDPRDPATKNAIALGDGILVLVEAGEPAPEPQRDAEPTTADTAVALARAWAEELGEWSSAIRMRAIALLVSLERLWRRAVPNGPHRYATGLGALARATLRNVARGGVHAALVARRLARGGVHAALVASGWTSALWHSRRAVAARHLSTGAVVGLWTRCQAWIAAVRSHGTSKISLPRIRITPSWLPFVSGAGLGAMAMWFAIAPLRVDVTPSMVRQPSQPGSHASTAAPGTGVPSQGQPSQLSVAEASAGVARAPDSARVRDQPPVVPEPRRQPAFASSATPTATPTGNAAASGAARQPPAAIGTSARPEAGRTQARAQLPFPGDVVRFRGLLAVDSGPTGAQVFIDGLLVGTTPMVLEGVPVGSRVVRVQLEGYEAWSSAARVVANQRTSVTAALYRPPAASASRATRQPAPVARREPLAAIGTSAQAEAVRTQARAQLAVPGDVVRFRGQLAVDSGPPGAQVFIDGLLVGTTPVVIDGLPIGSRVVRVQLEGYEAWSSAVRVVADQRTSVTAALYRPPGAGAGSRAIGR